MNATKGKFTKSLFVQWLCASHITHKINLKRKFKCWSQSITLPLKQKHDKILIHVSTLTAWWPSRQFTEAVCQLTWCKLQHEASTQLTFPFLRSDSFTHKHHLTHLQQIFYLLIQGVYIGNTDNFSWTFVSFSFDIISNMLLPFVYYSCNNMHCITQLLFLILFMPLLEYSCTCLSIPTNM